MLKHKFLVNIHTFCISDMIVTVDPSGNSSSLDNHLKNHLQFNLFSLVTMAHAFRYI